MEIALVNFVRNMYWNDRENLEIEILDQCLKKENIKSVIYNIKESDIATFRNNFLKSCKAVIFSCDFNINENIIREIYNFANEIKVHNKNCDIMVFGERAMLCGQDIMNSCNAIDYVFLGYPEDFAPIVKLITQNDRSVEGLSGFYFRNGGTTNKIEIDETISETIPWATRDKKILLGTKQAKIRTTRGCKGRCTFCIDVGYNKIWKGRTPEDIVDEIESIIKIYNIRQFSFYDNSIEDSIELDKIRLKNIMDELERRNLRIYFTCSARAESFKETMSDKELICQMSRLGLFNIVFGLESGSQRDLSLFNKRASVEDNYRAVNLFQKEDVNILTVPGFIMFHPYSTLESLKFNKDFLWSIGKSYSFLTYCSTMRVFKGTRIYSDLRNDNLLDKSFNYINTQSYMYANEEIGMLGKSFESIRDHSKAVEVGMALENAVNLLTKVHKQYTDWNNIEEFQNELESLKHSYSVYIDDFFGKCIEIVASGWSESAFKEEYDKLEQYANTYNVSSVCKEFIKSNFRNPELNVLL